MASIDVIKELLVSENTLLEEAVRKAKDFIAIEEKSGATILRVPKSSLTARELVLLLLLGRYFANQLGLTKPANISLTELSIQSGIDEKTLSSRLTDLTRDGWVIRVDRGEFVVNKFLLPGILDDIVRSRQRSETAQPQTATERQTHNEASSSQVVEAYPSIDGALGIRSAIIQLMRSSWGRTPRDWREINEALKGNALLFSSGNVTGTLTQLVQTRKLRRVKVGGIYKYQAVLTHSEGG